MFALFAVPTDSLAIIYLQQAEREGDHGQYEEALRLAFLALEQSENSGNDSLVAYSLIKLGKFYKVLGLFDLSIRNLEKAEPICLSMNDSACLAITYNVLGNSWSKKGNKIKTLEYYERALDIAEKIDLKKSVSAVSNNLANIYKDEGNFDKALVFYFRALQISKEIKDLHGEAFYENNIGSLYQTMGDPERALPHQQKALSLARKIGENVLLVNTLSQLGRTYKALGRFDSAYYCTEEYADMIEKVFTENSSRQINEMQTKYETEKKQKEIEHLVREKRSQEIIKYFMAGGIVILLLLAFMILNRYRLKNKANKELSAAYQIIEEKNRSITDSIRYARRIQSSLLPTQKYIQRNLDRLKSKKD